MSCQLMSCNVIVWYVQKEDCLQWIIYQHLSICIDIPHKSYIYNHMTSQCICIYIYICMYCEHIYIYILLNIYIYIIYIHIYIHDIYIYIYIYISQNIPLYNVLVRLQSPWQGLCREGGGHGEFAGEGHAGARSSVIQFQRD